MQKIKDSRDKLESLIFCKSKSKNQNPFYALKIPKDSKSFLSYKFYCCYSKKEECNFSVIHKNRVYCSYLS